MAKKTPDIQGTVREKVGPGRPPMSTRFKPGQSGNPGGKPKNDFSITRLLRDAMEKREIAGVPIPEGLTVGEAIRNRFLLEALTGTDFRYMKEVIDRIDGKPREPEGDPGSATVVNLIVRDDSYRKPAANHP